MELESEEVEHIVEDDDQEEHFKVIPVQLVESFENISGSSSAQQGTLVKGKYYKQTYRPAWELMPDFKGWLRGVKGQPTRAYCTYCHKTLHAHRLSLLKHTCTIRHQKAAQLHASRKAKMRQGGGSNQKSGGESGDEINNEDGEEVPQIEFADVEEDESEAEEQQVNEDRQSDSKETFSKNGSPPISTLVMDMTKGKPAGGLQVSLYKLIDGRWTYINEGITYPDGKFSSFFAERADFSQGRYKLHYDVDRYFEARKQPTIYPFIEIVFDCSSVSDSFHIPLMLSPFGYSTYKG